MDQKNVMKQVLDMNKTAFENSFNFVSMLQDQTEKAAGMYLKQMQWIPENGRKAVDEWLSACRQGRETFKSAVDSNFKKAEEFLSESPKQGS